MSGRPCDRCGSTWWVSMGNGVCDACRRRDADRAARRAMLIVAPVVLPLLAYLVWLGLQLARWVHTNTPIEWWPL